MPENEGTENKPALSTEQQARAMVAQAAMVSQVSYCLLAATTNLTRAPGSGSEICYKRPYQLLLSNCLQSKFQGL